MAGIEPEVRQRLIESHTEPRLEPKVRRALIERYLKVADGRRKLVLSMIQPLELSISLRRSNADVLETLNQLLQDVRAASARLEKGVELTREEVEPLVQRMEAFYAGQR